MTTTPAMPELPRETVIAIGKKHFPKTTLSNAWFGFAADIALATLQAQPAAAGVSDAEINRLACLAGFSPVLVATDNGAFGRFGRAILALRPQAVPVGFDVEAMIRAVLPGGNYCDPQAVADAIRDYVAASPQAVPMTDEQRQQAYNKSWATSSDFFAGIEAAEAHHGITAPAGGERQA